MPLRELQHQLAEKVIWPQGPGKVQAQGVDREFYWVTRRVA